MPHDVALVEEHETDAGEPAQELVGFPQTRRLPLRQVDLRHVPGHDGLGSEADARQEHAHLLRGRVLRLVEDDEGVVERPAPHEGDRGDLDDAALEQLGRLLVAEDVVEGVVERPQVRVDLLDHVAGKEPQPLTGLDRGPGEHDPFDLLLQQGRGRHGHGEIRLPRPRRPDREDQVVPVDGLDVELLLRVAGRDDRLELGSERALGEEVHEVGRGLVPEDPDGRAHVAAPQGIPHGQQRGELREHAAGRCPRILLRPER